MKNKLLDPGPAEQASEGVKVPDRMLRQKMNAASGFAVKINTN